MNVWIITTGSSDVQLQNQDNWNNLQKKVRKQLKISKQFSPSETDQNGKKLFRYPARATGVVYSNAITEHYADLEFPILNSFSSYLKDKFKKEQTDLNRVIVLLTDQSEIVSAADKDKNSHFYWQDTCTLQPILQQYLQNQFPDVIKNNQLDFRVLKPKEGSRGLDDWNEVLTLVQKEFIKLSIPQDATVYVSHQAGTPAISSAVQFESLAQFGQRVKFLVSSEYSQETTTIDNSTYLEAIQRQKAKVLLEQYDYSAVKSLFEDYLDSETRILLNAAIQWNYANFDEFATGIKKISDKEFVDKVNERSQQWWWTAYEAAYLAIIRLKQGNTVESFFHAFRAVEGAFLEWGKQKFNPHIKVYNDRAYLQPSILNDSENYFKTAKIKDDPKKNNSIGNLKLKFEHLAQKLENQQENQEKPKGELLYGTTLYRLFEVQKPNYKKMPEYKRFVSAQDGISEKRNKNFHQLQGLTEQDVYRDWEVENLDQWEQKILTYLNFITEDDSQQTNENHQKSKSESLKEASLMAEVHQKIEKVIAPNSTNLDELQESK